MLRAEVGWSVNGIQGVEAHRKLYDGLSPLIFRVPNCVLRHLWPDRGFAMHYFVLFEITRPEEAPVAEGLGGQIAASYNTRGGFNFDQGGVQTSKACNTGVDWFYVAQAALNAKYFRHFENNLKQWKDHVQQKSKDRKVSPFEAENS